MGRFPLDDIWHKIPSFQNRNQRMPILVCGINHKTAPIELREKIIFSQEKIPLYLNDLATNENIREAVLISTCNRSELYCDSSQVSKARDWFCRQYPEHSGKLQDALYLYQDEAAITHMMEVACGLDSMILGESQILGQMKEAFSESCAAGSVNALFNRLFQQIFAVAKDIRTTTAIGACPVSVSSAAAHFIKEIFPGSLSDATVLTVGAGDTISLFLRHLKTNTAKRLFIANRNTANASMLADDFSAENISLREVPEVLGLADVVVCATGSLSPIITKNMVTDRQKPLFILDLAVPRNVDPDVSELAHIKLYSIDDLKDKIQQNRQGREHAAEKAREMIKIKSQEFMSWLSSLDRVVSTIRAYRKQIENICDAELAKSMRKLQRGEDSAQVMIAFARAFTNKLLHTPSVQLREAGLAGRLELLQLAQQLFAISDLESELL